MNDDSKIDLESDNVHFLEFSRDNIRDFIDGKEPLDDLTFAFDEAQANAEKGVQYIVIKIGGTT